MVFIHIHVFHEYEILQPLVRTAVPCFFMVTGYFLVKDRMLDSKRVVSQTRKTIKVTIVASLVYIVFYYVRCLILGVEFIIFDEPWNFLTRWLLIGDNVNYPFWYLTSCVHALLIIYALLKLGGSKLMTNRYVVAAVLLLSVLLNRYSFLFGITIEGFYSRNGLMCGLPCMMIGAMARIKGVAFRSGKTWFYIAALMVVCAYIELALLHFFHIKGSGSDFQIMTYPLAVWGFTFCVAHADCKRLSAKLKEKMVFISRTSSTNLYLYHLLVCAILMLFLPEMYANAELVCLIIVVLSVSYNKLKLRCH